MEERFMTHSVADHQNTMEILWLHLWGVLMSSIFLYRQCKECISILWIFVPDAMTVPPGNPEITLNRMRWIYCQNGMDLLPLQRHIKAAYCC